MPFQLDTRIPLGSDYGRPSNTLGDMLDLSMRMENLRGMQEQRDLINEQRRAAIERAREEKRREVGLNDLYTRNPEPSVSELAAIVPMVDAVKIFEGTTSLKNTNAANQAQRIASVVGGVLAYPENLRPMAWDAAQQQLVGEGKMKPEEVRPYDEDYARFLVRVAMSPTEQAQTDTARTNAETQAASEARIATDATTKREREAVAGAIPGLREAAKNANVQGYANIYAQLPRGQARAAGVPSVDEYLLNKPRSLKQLMDIGMTQAQIEEARHRQAQLEQDAAQHTVTEERLMAAAKQEVTRAAKQQAEVRREQAVKNLEDELRDPIKGALINADSEQEQRAAIEIRYLKETHQPVPLELAERKKNLALKALDKKKMDAEATGTPMPEAELRSRQLTIENEFRRAFDQPALSELPPAYKAKKDDQQSSSASPGLGDPRGGLLYRIGEQADRAWNAVRQAPNTSPTIPPLVPPRPAAPAPGPPGTIGALATGAPPAPPPAPAPAPPAPQRAATPGTMPVESMSVAQILQEVAAINAQLRSGSADRPVLQRRAVELERRYRMLKSRTR